MPIATVVLIARIAEGSRLSETKSERVLMSVLHKTDCAIPLKSHMYFITDISGQSGISRLSTAENISEPKIIYFALYLFERIPFTS